MSPIENEPTYSIYALEDPSTNKVRYIGLSNDPERRFKQHLKKAAWIKTLLANNITPRLKIVEENIMDIKTAEAREQHWIYHYEGAGCALENLTKNESALRERGEEKQRHQRLYDTYAYHLPHDDAEKLIRMMVAGHGIAGACAWEDTYITVVRTINRLAKRPGFNLHIDAFDAARITFDIFGYTWKDEADHE